MKRLLVGVVALTCLGCGQSKQETGAKVVVELQGLQAHADKVVSEMDKQKAAEAKLKADLAADPSPVAELALKQARAGFAKSFGDEAVATAKITVDPSTIKTFGGEKWTVRGQYDGKDGDGADRKTTWESTVRLMLGKLQVQAVRLDVDG
jgi:hypothetical protein